MSSEKQLKLTEQIHEYLKPHALGKSTEEIHEEFEEYDPEYIDNALEQLLEQSAVIYANDTWRWVGR